MKWNLRKIWPWLVGILFLLWLYIAFYSAHGYQEMLIPDGTDRFTASFSRVSNIIPINEDVSRDARIEERETSLTIQFTDETDGTVSQVDLSDCHLHTNGYTSTDNVHAQNLPLTLVEGHTYTVQYWAVCDGESVEGLSLALYGDTVSYRWLQALILITVVIGAACVWQLLRSDRGMVPAMLVLWCSLYVLYLLGMPLQLRTEEETAFARAYAVSNEMMDLEAEDENSNVYMDDIGLRNSGYLSYAVPLYRFWSHIGADADTSRAATVTYQDDGARTPRTYVDAAAITVARRMGCAYPVVYLAGSLLTGLVGLLVLGILLARCKKSSTRMRVMTVATLPSIFTALQLHSGIVGLFRPLESNCAWLRIDEILRRVVLYVMPKDGKGLLITWVPIVVIGIFVWKDTHKETMPERCERALLTGMVLISVIAALLRLQM